MLPTNKDFAWAYGFWLCDNSTGLGITNKEIVILKSFKSIVEKHFKEFEFPRIQVFLKSDIEKTEKIDIINELCWTLDVSSDRISFYINPKQYDKKVFQLYIRNKFLENHFKEYKNRYDKIFRDFEIELISGKLDADGNVNISRGMIEIYYISKNSLCQLEKDYGILMNLGLNPTIRKHKQGKALVVGSKKKDLDILMNFSKKLIPNIRLHYKKDALIKLSQCNRVREKDMKILSLISEDCNTSEKLREKLNYSQRSMRQIMQNLEESYLVSRKRKSRNEFYTYQVLHSNISCSNSTKDES